MTVKRLPPPSRSWPQPLQPFFEHFTRLGGQRGSGGLGAVTQLARIDAGRAKFRRVADEPWLDPGVWLDLGMELHAEYIGTQGKSLVAALRRRGEMDGALRQIEGVAVPMQHGGARQIP